METNEDKPKKDLPYISEESLKIARARRAEMDLCNVIVDEGIDLTQVFTDAEIDAENAKINAEISAKVNELIKKGNALPISIGGVIDEKDLKPEHIPDTGPTKLDISELIKDEVKDLKTGEVIKVVLTRRD